MGRERRRSEGGREGKGSEERESGHFWGLRGPSSQVVSECLELTGMRPGERTTWCFCLFSCSQTIDLAGRHGAHGDLKPIHCTCFAKILILSVYVHSVNLFLSERSGHRPGGQENGVLLQVCDLQCDPKWGTWFPGFLIWKMRRIRWAKMYQLAFAAWQTTPKL